MDDKVAMSEMLDRIRGIKEEIEEALWALDVRGDIEKALAVYRQAELNLQALDVSADDAAYGEQQRVLAYCLLRQGNVLRHMGEPEHALCLGRRELAAASASGDDVALARSLISNGTNQVVAGAMVEGLEMMEQARELFESGDSYDHQQGLGWYWILQADLANGGITGTGPREAVEAADRALEILKPIDNRPGVARAYAARAKAYEALGNEEQAAEDREAQEVYTG